MVKKSSPARPTKNPLPQGFSPDGDGHALKNKILLGLPPKEYSFILSKLTLVDL